MVCEVKTRRGLGYGDPLEALTRAKVARLRRLTAELVFEQLDGAPEPFPHLYGPLNTDAVVDVTDPFPA